jgi:phosphoribosylformylglycinamidine synthase
VLVNLGLLPGFDQSGLKREVALINNDCGQFRDQWVRLGFNHSSPCVFTSGLETLELPIRHGEGKLYAETDIVEKLEENHQVVMRYILPDDQPANGAFPFNPNGSTRDIAGICDPTGRVFGLMPHPEAFNHWTNHPDWTYRKEQFRRRGIPIPEEGDGIKIFRNAVRYFN